MINSSLAVNRGANINLTFDLLNNARPQGGGFDIGAFEYGSSIPISSNTPTVSPTPGTRPGDTDGDGDVDIYDYNNLISHFGQSFAAADFNHNGTVDIYDYNTLMSNFGK